MTVSLEQTDFSPQCRQLLKDYLQQLESLDKTFPTRALNYLLNGEDESILFELQAIKDIDQIANINNPQINPLHAKFLNTVESENVEFFIRLAKLFSACVGRIFTRQYQLLPLEQGYYLDPFIFIATQSDYFQFLISKPLVISSIKFSLLEKMLQAHGENIENLIGKIYHVNPYISDELHLYWSISGLDGFAEYSVKHPMIIISALKQRKSYQCANALELLLLRSVPIDQFIDQIVDQALKSDKNTYNFALQLLQSNTAKSIPQVIARLNSNRANQRINAVNLLYELAREDAFQELTEHREQEQDEDVIIVIDQILSLQKDRSIDSEVDQTEPAPIELNQPFIQKLLRLHKRKQMLTG